MVFVLESSEFDNEKNKIVLEMSNFDINYVSFSYRTPLYYVIVNRCFRTDFKNI